jgi:glucokinase
LRVNPKLVAAIDGENVSFGIVEDGHGVRLSSVSLCKASDFPTFTDALQGYTREQRLSTAGLPLGLAVAGVTRGDTISLPNCRWYISVSGVKAFLAHAPLVLNDFESIAWSLPGLDAGRLRTIGPVAPRPVRPGGTFLVVGTGPGLGMAILAVDPDGKTRVIAGEGGHASFSPQNAEEDALLLALREKLGHVSFERLLAGFGLQFIHSWVRERPGSEGPGAEEIAAAAQRGDPAARRAVAIFARILGSFTGNVVLSTGTFDGVFLVSPLIGAVLPALGDPAFRAAFTGKGRMKKALEPVPIAYAQQDHARLHGAAAALRVAQPASA